MFPLIGHIKLQLITASVILNLLFNDWFDGFNQLKEKITE